MTDFLIWFALHFPPLAIFALFILVAIGSVGRFFFCDHPKVANGRWKSGSLAFGFGALFFGSNYLWIGLGSTPTLVQSGIFRFSALWMALAALHMNAGVFEVIVAKARFKISSLTKGIFQWKASTH